MAVAVKMDMGSDPCLMKAKLRQDRVEKSRIVFCCPGHMVENGVKPAVRRPPYSAAFTVLYGIHVTIRHSPYCTAFAILCGIHRIVRHVPYCTSFTVLVRHPP